MSLNDSKLTADDSTTPQPKPEYTMKSPTRNSNNWLVFGNQTQVHARTTDHTQDEQSYWKEIERRQKDWADRVETEYREMVRKLVWRFRVGEEWRLNHPVESEKEPTPEEIRNMNDLESRAHVARVSQRSRLKRLVRRNDPPDLPRRSGGFQTTGMP
jgi:hypothetical protein